MRDKQVIWVLEQERSWGVHTWVDQRWTLSRRLVCESIPGEVVEGKISIKSDKPVPGDCISIEVFGKEKVSYTDILDDTKNRSNKRTFLTSKAKNFDIPNSSLPPGDYEIPFMFVLPES